MKKNLICINCPRGCNLEIDTKSLSVTGIFALKVKNMLKMKLLYQKEQLLQLY